MKRLSALIAVVVFCCVCADKVGAASPGVEQARQHGALGQVTLRVEDSTGNPVEGANVSVVFWTSDSSADVVVSEGTTDTNGLFLAEGKTIHSMNFTVTKDGHYKTAGEYWFYRRGEECVQNGRWQPWNAIHQVVLKEKREPIAMYARHVDAAIPTRDLPVGFDLEIGDWVAPYGAGKHADASFTYIADAQDFWTGVYELTIACSNGVDGLVRAQKDILSEFVSVYEARRDGYATCVVLCLNTTKEKILKKELFGAEEYLTLRLRTVLNEEGSIVSARYGKIYGPIEFGVGKDHHVRFTYYLNPAPNDRNLEFDPKQNLFKDLKPMEQVRDP